MSRFLVPAFGLAGVPFLFWVGYLEGIASLGDSDQVHQHLDSLFVKQDNTFKNKAVLPPIRRIKYPRFTILYSTILKTPIAVHQSINEATIGQRSVADQLIQGVDIEDKLLRQHHKPNIDTSGRKETGFMASPVNYKEQEMHMNAVGSFANLFEHGNESLKSAWNSFEEYQRSLTKRCKDVEIISGPLFSTNEPNKEEMEIYRTGYQTRGKYGAAVPAALYKIIKCSKQEASYVSAFRFDKETTSDSTKPLSSFEVPLSLIEKQTGLVFKVAGLPPLSDVDQASLSKTRDQFEREELEARIHSCQSFKEMRDKYNKYKAYGMPEGEALKKKVQKLARARLEEIEMDATIGECERIPQYLQVRCLVTKDAQLTKRLIEAENDSFKVCDGKEKLQTLKKKVVALTSNNSYGADLLKKIDKKLAEKRNR